MLGHSTEQVYNLNVRIKILGKKKYLNIIYVG